MSPNFISTFVVRKHVLLMQIVTIELHRSIQELEDFATIIEELILSLTLKRRFHEYEIKKKPLG